MSSRTKSFFEQDHRSKRPGQWSRQPHRPALSETSTNVQIAKPPIPPTSKAKARLQSFQFNEELSPVSAPPLIEVKDVQFRTTPTHDDAETPVKRQQLKEQISVPSDGAAVSQKYGQDKSDEPAQGHSTIMFPSTPAMRLPLEDLIGNFENTKDAEPHDQSPKEFIGWIPNSSTKLFTPDTRKRKRARSSSPACPSTSQRCDVYHALLDGTAAFDRPVIDADPALDLWRRYGAKQSEGESRPPDFSRLISQESPKTLETPLKLGGLRRWASTGNDWPSCGSKRKRTSGTTKIAQWQTKPTGDSNSKSRVANMLDKLQQSLATQKLAGSALRPADKMDAPSSSSPLPETKFDKDLTSPTTISPLVAKAPVALRKTKCANAPTKSLHSLVKQIAPAIDRSIPKFNLTSNVDDTRRVEHHNSPPLPTSIHIQNKGPLPPYKRPSILRPALPAVGQKVSQIKQLAPFPEAPMDTTSVANKDDLDEFGDVLDLSAEDLEELLDTTPTLPHPDTFKTSTAPNYSGTPSVVAPPGSQVQNNVLNTSFHANDFDDDDEFACDEVDEEMLAQAESRATQEIMIPPRRPSPKRHRCQQSSSLARKYQDDDIRSFQPQRYVIKRIVDGSYPNHKGAQVPERLLLAEDERGSMPTAITLRESWSSTPVGVGDAIHVVHICGDLERGATQGSPPGQLVVSDSSTSAMITVHPDHMLSATTVADSFDCVRKAVLQDRIKATSETNKAMVYGKILHEIVQQALSLNKWSDAFLASVIEQTVLNNLEGLWELGMQDTVLVVEELRAKMAELSAWANVFVANEPSLDCVVEDKQGSSSYISLSKLIAVEEHIWAPKYGLKGNIDATVETTSLRMSNEPARKLIMPFEIKTGRATHSSAHRAQTALYTLLLSDRYNVPVSAGILYYLESSAMSRVAPPLVEIRQMLQQRNRLASHIHKARHPDSRDAVEFEGSRPHDIEEGLPLANSLPSMLKNPYKCGRCYARQSCFTLHALVEGGSSESAGMIDDGKKDHSGAWHEAVGHLALTARDKTQAERLQSWFTKWDKLLTLEESDISRFSREIWTMTSEEREAVGRCFGGLVITNRFTGDSKPVVSNATGEIDGIATSGGKINRFVYTFVRAQHKSAQSFTEGSQLTTGEPVVVSSEHGQWALANGYIVAVHRDRITVAVDRKLGNARDRLLGFNKSDNQAFRGIMSVGGEMGSQLDGKSSEQLYRLDKDEFSNGLAMIRNNLITLMSTHPIHTKLRKQIVHDQAPEFMDNMGTMPLAPSPLGCMNVDQQAAIAKVLAAKDYALIMGMPGTGKTTTIAHLIKALMAEEKTILLTSFTHTAVDNILLKIRDIVPVGSVLRLGVPAKIDPRVQEFCQLVNTPRGSIEEINSAYMDSKIVATTCMGTNHALFRRRFFDVCIVDEASQITLPTSLGPLLHARKFVLVGDHFQLPPLVQNRAAQEGGLDVSLFRYLSEKHPQAVAALGEQYRMCEEIMGLSNALIYGGRLRCGNQSVAKRTMHINDLSRLSTFHTAASSCSKMLASSRCWLRRFTAPEHKVVFANIDSTGSAGLETLTSGKNITNSLEATLSVQLVLGLLAIGVPGKEIGIITLYRSQLALIRQLFRRAGIGSEVEIDSADRFQGRDKECIILSMVRSNESGIVGDLLKDWRRVNVALTRAKSKLIILGSRRTLKNNNVLAKFLELVDNAAWAVDLPKDAAECHNFATWTATAPSQSSDIPVKQPSPEHKSKLGLDETARTPAGNNSLGSRKPFQRASSSNLVNSHRGMKSAGKVVKENGFGNPNTRKLKEQFAIEIFEDLLVDDLQ